MKNGLKVFIGEIANAKRGTGTRWKCKAKSLTKREVVKV